MLIWRRRYTPYTKPLSCLTCRAGVEAGGGAWCPRQQVTREGKEHLEVYLGRLHVVTKVEVQGRFGNGQGREYTEQYKLQYWRPGMEHWATYTDGTGNQVSLL